MSRRQLRPGLTRSTVQTSRLAMDVLSTGPDDGVPLILIHGNISTGRFFEDLMVALPKKFRVLAPTLRGFGDTEAKPIDGTRGVRDFSDDIQSLVEALNLTDGGKKVHLVGWSVGGAVAMQYAVDYSDKLGSITLENPMSPFGFGGTRDNEGNACSADWAGTGAGTANPDFIQSIKDKDTGVGHPNTTRNVVDNFFVKADFKFDEDTLALFVDEILKTTLGEDFYPGDVATCESWPGICPGTKGMNNAISGQYTNLSAFADIAHKVPVLWMRGADDQIVSDTSFFDFGFLGQAGFVPGWPGNEAFPPQPMVSQTRAVLDAYAANGGQYVEEVVADCGHSIHLEKPEAFQTRLLAFLSDQA